MKILVSPANYIVDINSVSEFYYSAKLLFDLAKQDSGNEYHILCGYCSNKEQLSGNMKVYELYKNADVKITILKRIEFYLWVAYKSIVLASKNKYDIVWHLLPNGLSSYNLFILLNIHKIFRIRKAVIGRLAQSYGEEEPGTFIYSGGKVQVIKTKLNILGFIYKILSKINRHYFSKFDYFIFYNEYARILFSRELNINFDESNSRIIPVGIDVEKFPFVEKKLGETMNFLYLGNLIERKNIDLAITLCHKLMSSGIKLKLTIVGSGYKLDELTELVKSYKMEDVVHFQGFVPKDKINNFLKDSHFLFLLSRKEAFGHVLLEALVSGTVFIGSNIPPFQEIIDHKKNGILVGIDDEHSQYEFIQTIKNITDETYSTLTKHGYETSKLYWWPSVILQYKEIINASIYKK